MSEVPLHASVITRKAGEVPTVQFPPGAFSEALIPESLAPPLLSKTAEARRLTPGKVIVGVPLHPTVVNSGFVPVVLWSWGEYSTILLWVVCLQATIQLKHCKLFQDSP